MSKIGSDRLFYLIQSMNRQERRYFKIFSRTHIIGKENKYVQLFDAIAQQEIYNEKEIVEEYKNFAYGKQFAAAKKYLYDQILSSMENYRSSTDAEMRSLINRAEFLFEKGLYSQCSRLIKKTKQKAWQSEMYPVLLNLYSLEHKLHIQNQNIEGMKRLLKEEERTWKYMHYTWQYRVMADSIYISYLLRGSEKESIRIKNVEEIIRHPLLKVKTFRNLAHTSFEAKRLFYWIHANYHQIKGDFLKSYTHIKSIIDLFQQYPQKQKGQLDMYIDTLNKMFVLCGQLNMYNEMLNCMEMFSSVKPFIRPQSEAAKTFFYRYATYTFHYHIKTGKFNEMEKKLTALLLEMKQHDRKLNSVEKGILFWNTAIIFFGSGNYRQCISYLNKVRNMNLISREDVKIYFMIFYLLAHFEAGNTVLLPSLIKSTNNMLKATKHPFIAVHLLLEFFRNTEKPISREKSKKQFIELKEKILPCSMNSSEKQIFDFFDFISWIDNKIQNRSFAEVVKEKAESGN